jgi:AAA15 family ATPase/GTPase
MEKALDKHKILEAAIRQHETVIHDFHERIKEMMQTDGNVNEEGYDNQEQAFKSETTAKVSAISEQLEFANHELEELMKMPSDLGTIHNTIQRGSVVRTDKEIFFVSASIERFYVDGAPFFGLSVMTPLYQAMKGKKAGSTVSYGSTGYRILDVF